MKQRSRTILLSVLLMLVLAVGLLPGMSLSAYADNAYSGGTGTETDPWLISTVDDWKALAAAVNGGEKYKGNYFRQTADLDMSGAGSLNPVGTLAVPFAGNYEGDGFEISNAAITGMACTVQNYNMNVAGLFGALVEGGSISNLKVTNVSATATSGSGGWDQAYAGGLVAFAENCTITDCSVSNSTITSSGSNNFAGAFVGFAGAENSEKTTFSKCASENNRVNTMGYGGGFIGAIVNYTSSDDAISFTDCYSARNSADAGAHNYGTVGGFLGGSQDGNVTAQNCFVYDCNATATGTGSFKGVFAGDIYYGTVKATDTYYYDTHNLPVNAESATAKTADEMKSLASTLGDAFKQGSYYPILLHPVTAPRITGANLVLDGTLDFRFYVALPANFNANGAHMVFTIHGRTIDVPFADAETSIEDATRDQKIFSCPVYSIEMAETVKAEFHYGAGKTVTKNWSIKEYLDALDVQTSDAALKNLINATRDYGHYIQPYLARLHKFTIGTGGYAVMPAASSSITPVTAEELDNYKTVWNDYKTSVLDSVSYYDTFAESTTLHVLVKLKSAKTVTATVDDAGSTVTSLGNNTYGIEIPSIAANNLGKTYHVVFSADGSAFCDIKVSALTYVRAVLASRNETDEAAALTAFYNYYTAAKAYPGN